MSKEKKENMINGWKVCKKCGNINLINIQITIDIFNTETLDNIEEGEYNIVVCLECFKKTKLVEEFSKLYEDMNAKETLKYIETLVGDNLRKNKDTEGI